jgi:predicted alpha/beta superfamily hydrolase
MKTLFILIFSPFSLILHAQSTFPTISKYPIESAILNETREVWIGLPRNYDSTKRYPTLYVMDAEDQFEVTYAIMRELSASDKIPNHIVIGIPQVDYLHRFSDLTFTASEYNSAGQKDATSALYFSAENTGKGNTFLKYLTQEVVPFIDKQFNTNGFDVFIGHSLSGYFGAYILTMEHPFNAFQLYDPSIWYNLGDAIKHYSNTVREETTSNVFISTANGGRDRQQYNVDTQKQFYDSLIGRKLNASLQIYAEDHGAVRLPSLIDGLTKLYEGFSFGYIFPEDTITVADANKHYVEFSEKINFVFNCPVETYRWIGFANYSQNKWEQAIEAYQLCTSLYNQDAYMLLEFADCYFQIKEYNLSETFYQKVLAIEPTNDQALSKIEAIKKLRQKKKNRTPNTFSNG